ncbi:MAG: phasin family protein [Gammaproteobacteria bacterium]|nr:phasin family protein [Gammaproteobacteria bacterium]
MNQINEQFANTTKQFADTAAQVNRLTLENAQNVFGLQLAAIQDNVNATFAFWGELAEVRDLDGLKSVLPKGVQVARENVERSISVGQEVLGRTVKTNEAIGQIAKSQIESATAKAQAETETVVNRASEQVRSNLEAVNKAAKQK